MPTYQYRCTECGHDLEAVQKFTDAALTECPNCGGQLRKVFNAVGVVFKGSGFYRTDSRNGNGNGNRNGGSESAGSGKESGGKESGGKESKTESGGSSGAKESKSPAPAASSAPSSGSSTGSKAAGS